MTDTAHSPNSNQKPLVLIAIVLAAFATVLGIISAGDNVLGWDLTFARWIQRWEGNLGEGLYNIGDMLGTTSLAATVTVIALLIAIAMKRIHISVFLILVLLLRLAGTQLKPLFDSPRPMADHVRLLETYDGTGYPSGHSMTVAMVSTMLVVIAWRYLGSISLKWAVTALAALAIILVGWSRVWSGAHWPSDVLGGWSYGISLVLIAWMLADVIVFRVFAREDAAPQTATD